MSQVGGTGLQCSGRDSWECREDAEAETDNEHGKKKKNNHRGYISHSQFLFYFKGS